MMLWRLFSAGKSLGMGTDMRYFSSDRALKLTESVIREMAQICLKHQGVNLAQEFPHLPASPEIEQMTLTAIKADLNRRAITWGVRPSSSRCGKVTNRWFLRIFVGRLGLIPKNVFQTPPPGGYPLKGVPMHGKNPCLNFSNLSCSTLASLLFTLDRNHWPLCVGICNGDCPADHYVRSLQRRTQEDLALLLIHEEPRKVIRTGCITYYGQCENWTSYNPTGCHLQCRYLRRFSRCFSSLDSWGTIPHSGQCQMAPSS